MTNDYQIVDGNMHYAIFTDGEGKRQIVNVAKEIADTIIHDQRAENALMGL